MKKQNLVCEKLRLYRLKAGFSQRQVSKKLGTTQSLISQYENGYRKPKLETLQKFATLYGCKVTDIIDLDK